MDLSAHQCWQQAPFTPGSPTISGWWHCPVPCATFHCCPLAGAKEQQPSRERPDKQKRGSSAFPPWGAHCPHSTVTSAHLSPPSHPPVHESPYAAGLLCGSRLTPLPWQFAVYTFFYLTLRKPPQNDHVAPGC